MTYLTKNSFEKVMILFLITVPYGYFGLNLIGSDTNPLSMYLLPIVLLIILGITKGLFKVEMSYILVIGIFAVSVIVNFPDLQYREAIIKLAGLTVGFGYFFLAARGFGLGTRAERYLISAYRPVLLVGVIQVLSLLTGDLFSLRRVIREVLVSNPSQIPYRISLLVSEPSFMAFQVPLLLYLYHKYKRWEEMTILFVILFFTKSVNVYLIVFVFYVSYFTYKLIVSDNKKYYLLLSVALAPITYYIMDLSGISNRILAIQSDYSARVRFGFALSVLFTFIEYPLGVGAGQYGSVAQEIILKYNVPFPARYPISTLSSNVNPWSFIVGLLAEGGIFVIPALVYFSVKIFRMSLDNAAIFSSAVCSTFLLLQVHPPATPYIWIMLGLVVYNAQSNSNNTIKNESVRKNQNRRFSVD